MKINVICLKRRFAFAQYQTNKNSQLVGVELPPGRQTLKTPRFLIDILSIEWVNSPSEV